MPHVSKKKIEKKESDRLYAELVRSFERSARQSYSKRIFNEFFTETEKVMFAKRLAVIAMLSKNISSYMIYETLGMSPRTIQYMSLRYEEGKYDEVIRHALGKKDIWDILEDIFTVGGYMPQRVGGKRWQTLNRLAYNENLKKR